MSSSSTYLRNAFYRAAFRNTSFQGAAQLYFSLHTSAPGLVGDNEVSGNDYARVELDMADCTDGAGASEITVTFPAPDPASWGVVTHWGIWDSLTVGNFYGGDSLLNAITTSIGVPVSFPIGNITWVIS